MFSFRYPRLMVDSGKQVLPLFDLTSHAIWAQWGTVDERRINRFILRRTTRRTYDHTAVDWRIDQ